MVARFSYHCSLVNGLSALILKLKCNLSRHLAAGFRNFGIFGETHLVLAVAVATGGTTGHFCGV